MPMHMPLDAHAPTNALRCIPHILTAVYLVFKQHKLMAEMRVWDTVRHAYASVVSRRLETWPACEGGRTHEKGEHEGACTNYYVRREGGTHANADAMLMRLAFR